MSSVYFADRVRLHLECAALSQPEWRWTTFAANGCAEETWYANALEASGVRSFVLLCTAGWPFSQARRREIGAKGYRLGLVCWGTSPIQPIRCCIGIGEALGWGHVALVTNSAVATESTFANTRRDFIRGQQPWF